MGVKMGTFLGWNLINNKLVPYKLFLVSTQSCFTSQPWITSSSKRTKFSTLKFNMKCWYFQNTKFRFALDLDLRTRHNAAASPAAPSLVVAMLLALGLV